MQVAGEPLQAKPGGQSQLPVPLPVQHASGVDAAVQTLLEVLDVLQTHWPLVQVRVCVAGFNWL
jgi:hypothetical protein